jgi:hypothetical protein
MEHLSKQDPQIKYSYKGKLKNPPEE